MRKLILYTVAVLLLSCCLSLAAQTQPASHSFDPTNPEQVQTLRQFLVGPPAQQKAGHPPFRNGVDPRDDDKCWVYQADSNYDLVDGGCSYGSTPYNCVDNCYVNEQTCDDTCAANNPGSDCGTSGTACENCQDGCRDTFNSCMANCG